MRRARAHAESNDPTHDEEEEEESPTLKPPVEKAPNLNLLTTYEKKQFGKLRSYLNRCIQILESEIDKLESVHTSTPDREEEIKAHKNVIELMDKLLSRIRRGT